MNIYLLFGILVCNLLHSLANDINPSCLFSWYWLYTFH